MFAFPHPFVPKAWRRPCSIDMYENVPSRYTQLISFTNNKKRTRAVQNITTPAVYNHTVLITLQARPFT